MLLKLASREILNNRKFSFFYILNFTMGLIGLLVLFNLKESLQGTLEGRAKELLTADFSMHARRVLLDEEVIQVESLFSSKPLKKQRKVSLYSMAYNKDNFSRLLHIRGIESAYPFLGKITFKDGSDLAPEKIEQFQNTPSVWPYEETAQQFNLTVGDILNFGKTDFVVRGIITDDTSDGSMGFSLAPRVYVGLNNLIKTGLIDEKSTLFDTRYYLFDKNVDLAKLKEELDTNVEDNTIRFTDPETSAERSMRFFGVVNDYLSLVALVAFFLSVLGVNYLIQNYIEKKKKNVAILKSLGMSELSIQKVYVLELLILSLLSWLFSIVFLVISIEGLKYFLPKEIVVSFTMAPVWLGLFMSLTGSLLISLPFLKELNMLEPAYLLKGQSNLRTDLLKVLPYYLPLVLFLVVISIYLSHSFVLGSVFIATLLTSFIAFRLLSSAILIFLGKIQFKSVQLKLFAKAASRNASQFSSAVTALGIGVLLFNLLPTIEAGLSEELSSPDKNRIPSLFFIDIGEDELEEVRLHLSDQGHPLKGAAPMIRAKLVSVNGEKFEKANYKKKFGTREEERERWARNRGFNLTYPMNNEWKDYDLVAGRNFSGDYDLDDLETPIEVIMEKRFADRLDIELNDILEFDVQGVVIQSKVIGVRKVKWTTFRPNFFVSLQPQSMIDAPKSFIGVTEQMSNEERSKVMLSMSQKFPNVSVVDITRNIGRLLVMIDFLGMVFKALSLLSIFSGLIIISSLANYEAYKRVNEINLLKVLGMNKSGLLGINFIHYGVLGGISSLIGVMLSLVISYILVVNFFDGIWAPSLSLVFLSVLSVIFLTQIISWFSVRNIFNSSPSTLLETT